MAFNLQNDMYQITVIHHDEDGHKKAIIVLSFGMKGQLLGKTMPSDAVSSFFVVFFKLRELSQT